jgi:hypothetical protein
MAHASDCRNVAPAGKKLLERWVLLYGPTGVADGKQQNSRPMTSRLEPAAIYKKMVVALRSLYSFVRMLPAYCLYRACAVRPFSVVRLDASELRSAATPQLLRM